MKSEKSDSLYKFAPRRLREIESRAEALRSELVELDREMEVLRRLLPDQAPNPGRESGTVKGADGSETSAPKMDIKEGAPTIKSMALDVLRMAPEGLTNGEIGHAIEAKFKRRIGPKSLSPQLGRLQTDGAIVKTNNKWTLLSRSD